MRVSGWPMHGIWRMLRSTAGWKRWLFGGVVLVLAGLALVLWALPPKQRLLLFTAPDTWTYTVPACRFAHGGPLGPTHRPLGALLLLVPLCAAFPDPPTLIGVATMAQFGLVLVGLLVVVWQLDRVALEVPQWAKGIAAVVGAWALIDCALWVLSDLVAAVSFWVALYIVYWVRSGYGRWLGAACLAVATSCRPVFMVVPVLMLVTAWLLRHRVLPGAPRAALVVGLGGVLGVAGSTAFQVHSSGYWGPSPVMASNLRITDREARTPHLSRAQHRQQWFAELSAIAGEPLEQPLSPATEERLARVVVTRHVLAQPVVFARHLMLWTAIYALAPLEVLPVWMAQLATGRSFAELKSFRLVLGVVMLPLWGLALVPGPWLPARARRVAWVGLGWVVFFCAAAALAPRQGERMRLPAMVFVLPLLAWNLSALSRAFARVGQQQRASRGAVVKRD